MGRFVEVGKGDKDRTSDRRAFLENMERIYGKKAIQPGRYKQCPETGKMLPVVEWYEKYGKTVNPAPFVRGDIEPYESPATGKVVGSRRDQRYDLESSGSRLYEGRAQEEKEAARFREYEQQKYDESLGRAVEETANDLRYQNVKPETHIKSSWLMGED